MINRSCVCPICNKEAKLVSYITVKHLVKHNLQNKVIKAPYYLCMSHQCDVAYFSSNNNDIIYKNDLTIPIFFKDSADPKYICYCNKVTEEMILDAIHNKGASSIKEICDITGAMEKCNCIKNNPMGKCCSPNIKTILDNELK